MYDTLYWLIQNAADVPENDDWLSDAERDIVAGFRFTKRRNDWRLGRWTVKQAICAYQSLIAPVLAAHEIRAAADGAPEAFSDGVPERVSISISHSNGKGFCAVGPPGLSVGCDTELIEPREVQFFQDYFTPEEIALLRNPPVNRNLVAYLIWCAKESVLKSLREGLRLDTRSIVIHPSFEGNGNSWNTWSADFLPSARVFHGWWRVADGFVYALTADHTTPEPEQLRLTL
jgi:4'-phosphopantetheinyl transferase